MRPTEAAPQPIVVLGAPRSGTSLTASIFAAHGVWVGRCKPPGKHNQRGFFENLDAKERLIARCGRIVHRGELAPHLDRGVWAGDVDRILRHARYEGGPWLIKHSAMYWPVWVVDFDPLFVCCFRDYESIAASGQDSGLLTNRRAIRPHHATMTRLIHDGRGVRVDPERFVAGDFGQLAEAFRRAGLAFDEELARSCVDPELWHYASEPV